MLGNNPIRQMSSTEDFSITDIPQESFRSITEHLWNFAIGFVRVDRDRKRQDVQLLGSGVLVSANNIRAILTAAHVITDAPLPESGRLGVILSTQAEQTTIDTSGLGYQVIERGTNEKDGPDLGVIRLPPSTAATLEARKVFYNLDRYKQRMLTKPPEENEGVWIANGFVSELTIVDPDPGPHEMVKGFCNFSSIGGVDPKTVRGRYDYYRFPVIHQTDEHLPNDFRGVSGSGLWQVSLGRRQDGVFVPHEYLLQGVTYFQEPYIDNKSALHCHGPKSIYEIAYSAIVGV